jgi:peptidoglycan/LPS O-acetylase OafA/YrhL
MEIPYRLQSKKLSSLDGLRGISIALVILSHFTYNSTFNEKTEFGLIGVDIFFVISGFLITTLLLKEKTLNGYINLRKFYIRRALRILPVVFLFLSVLLLLNSIYNLQIKPISFFASLLFIRNLPIPNCSDWYTSHFWSLGVEEQFYLLFPFLISRLSLNTYKKIILLLICIIPITDYLFYNKMGVFYSQKSFHIIGLVFVNLFGKGTALILVGSYLSVLMFTRSKFIESISGTKQKNLSLLIFIVAIAIMIPSSVFYFQYFSEIVFAFLIGIIIIMNLSGNNIMARLLNLKLIAEIGILSYSLYLWQQIFTHNQPWKGDFPYSDSIILNFFLMVVAGYLSYYFYERKFLKLKSKFTSIDSPSA